MREGTRPTSRYISRAAARTREIRIFLSSGDDASALRDRFERVVREVDEQFSMRSDLRFRVVRWESVPAQKAPDGNVNALFVNMARDSHLTVVLLLDQIRPGTLEEMEAVLTESDVQLAVLWFRAGPDEAPALQEFLEKHRARLLYNATGPPDSEEAWLTMVRIITSVIVDAISPAEGEEVFSEVR